MPRPLFLTMYPHITDCDTFEFLSDVYKLEGSKGALMKSIILLLVGYLESLKKFASAGLISLAIWAQCPEIVIPLLSTDHKDVTAQALCMSGLSIKACKTISLKPTNFFYNSVLQYIKKLEKES